MLGKEKLPVIMADTRLARVIMISCHEEDHRRSAADTLARSKNHAWISYGSRLAKSVCKSCVKCRLAAKKTVEQIMGKLQDDILEVSPPFTCTALDLFGPYQCRGMGAGVRKSMLVWGVIFACLRSKAVSILACAGYDTQSFRSTLSRFCSIYGDPAVIISDQGSQLCAAAKLSQRDINLDSIRNLTARTGTHWIFTERGCPWRNGTAERAVGLAKTTLSHQLEGHKSLNFAEMDELFLRVAHIINSRPIGVRFLTEEDYQPITPNNLLLGRAAGHRSKESDDVDEETDLDNVGDPTKHLSVQEEICEKWWEKWAEIAFPLLAPRKKWNKEQRNLQEGDVVLLQYESKVSKGRYRLARIVKVHPDKSGLVRTVTIQLRPRHAKEKATPYKARKMTEFPVAVQRLVVIVPREEQPGDEFPGDAQDDQDAAEVGGAMSPELDDFGSAAADTTGERAQRRSRRLRGEPPEKFLAAVGHSLLPRPWTDPCPIPAAAYSLHSGALPLLVPEWLPDVMQESQEDVQSVIPYEGE